MNTAAAWGKFAAEILSGNWDGAMEELNKVKEIINDRVSSHAFDVDIVLFESNDTTIPPNMVDPLVSLPLLQYRERS